MVGFARIREDGELLGLVLSCSCPFNTVDIYNQRLIIVCATSVEIHYTSRLLIDPIKTSSAVAILTEELVPLASNLDLGCEDAGTV